MTSASLLAGLAYAVPAQAADPLPDNPGSRITFGEGARANRCATGFALHIGGPAATVGTPSTRAACSVR